MTYLLDKTNAHYVVNHIFIQTRAAKDKLLLFPNMIRRAKTLVCLIIITS